MKALIWKEFRDTLKAATVPIAVGFLIVLSVSMDESYDANDFDEVATVCSVLSAIWATIVGFLHFSQEARGERRALLLHRPIRRTHIFLVRAGAGITSLLIGVGVPYAYFVGWAAVTRGAETQVSTAIFGFVGLLMGGIYYLAPAIIVQSEARLNGSRFLALAGPILGSVLVFGWAQPSVVLGLAVVGVLGAVLGAAAWGAFLTGGEYAPQPRIARACLAITLLIGLGATGIWVKTMVGDAANLGGRPSPPAEQVLLGPLTSPAELFGYQAAGSRYPRMDHLELRTKEDRTARLAFVATAFRWFIPGGPWQPEADPPIVRTFRTVVLVSAAICGVACFLLARRNAFSIAGTLGWSIFGLVAGIWGLLLLLMLVEWPMRVSCPSCRKLRVVSREICEHCGAPHQSPACDGTEVFESTGRSPVVASA
jgi:hypothetical protein